jgi:hypothetical protein
MAVAPRPVVPVDAVTLLYPIASELSPRALFHTPTAVESIPALDVAEAVPVIIPVVMSGVAPAELFKIPRLTELVPMELKFLFPNNTDSFLMASFI